ncbi:MULTISPECIES: ATP-binding protein [unclassified Streptomyces]|uniref:ATP-binding protein n=1 Tax=unclassified Streptomyces TaxID=2593676 RepID=UPI0022B66DC9|nr:MULTISPECIES: ATP-binding protein [unclassified Streptomyces]MCZ7417107.1 PspC domain-containing protein [Streptomyces sp. WMMC897]MCZ7433065.1 PspC domain-containing protein [Streptomyces sp. WMMC1477]
MTTVAPAPAEDPPLRKLYRSSEGNWLGGVARGLAGHLALPVLWVRVVFLLLFFTSGLGALLYAVFWFVVPLGAGGVAAGRRAAAPGGKRWLRRPDRGQISAVLVMFAALLALGANLQFGRANAYLWPLVIMGIGVAVVWRQADNARRAHWEEVGRRHRLLPIARSAAGMVLVGVGVTGFVVIQGSAEQFGAVLQASLAVLVGIALLAGPYLVRITQDLSEERTMRIRAQERAEVAAHVHDSVLHTLTLIQRNADSAREVARLARAQERELREWLYRGAPRAGAEEEPETPRTLAEAVKKTAAEVEDHHGVPVEVVCVGDCPCDERLSALVQAAREAMVNAAKYGGEGGAVQVFAEVEGRGVFVSVRDRGPGFDLDAVPADRMGVRESVIGRMERNGGTARIRTAPGEGTEVELEMERAETA